MSTQLIRRIAAFNHIRPVRFFLIIIGCAGIWWGISGFRQQISLERIASQIIAGEPFKATTLAQQLSAIEDIDSAAYCRPAALRSAAIIRLRMVETAASSGARRPDDEELKSLGKAVRNSLSCLPADPFLWLVLYWVESTQNAIRPENLAHLRMSYLLGPNEGWIIFKRNPIAFANFTLLPADLADDAINEFLALIKSQLYREAVEIFSGPAWQLRDTVLPHLAALPLRDREIFAKVASEKGLAIVVPGVEPPKSHPWQ